MTYNGVRQILTANASLPVLVRTSRGYGYSAVAAVSTVQFQETGLLPAAAPASEGWLLWKLEPHLALSAAAVVPRPAWDLPDLAGAATAGELAAAAGASYNSLVMALAQPGWVGPCRDTYRHAVMIESGGAQALVFFFDL